MTIPTTDPDPDLAGATSPTIALDRTELKGLLLRNWMTHDAMWFASAVDQLGIAQANRLNLSAVHGMAAIEAKRIRKILGLEEVRSNADLRRFFDTAVDLVIPDFMDFTMSWGPDNSSVHFEMHKCFAFDGVSLLGVADTYECGIYERIFGWLDGLGVGYEVTPEVDLCTMHHDGRCERTISFQLAAADDVSP